MSLVPSFPSDTRIVVAGAGSIGCFVGGLLRASGRNVALLARPRLIEAIARAGLRMTDSTGLDVQVPAGGISASAEPALFATAQVILVTVKSGDTRAMAAAIKAHGPSDAVVVSLQNGIENADVLREALPNHRVLGGMVPFNVVQAADGRFHRGTTGDIVIESGVPGLADLLSLADLEIVTSDDIAGVQWGKLLLNLNNALNALSGLPLREQLASRDWRRILADQMDEALQLMTRAGIRPRAATPLPPRLLPTLLRLPTPLFRLIAGRMLKIDATARSSMWEDLERRRVTEIDQLQGAIMRLAERQGMAAPVATRITLLVRRAEAVAGGSPRLTARQVRSD